MAGMGTVMSNRRMWTNIKVRGEDGMNCTGDYEDKLVTYGTSTGLLTSRQDRASFHSLLDDNGATYDVY